MEFSRAFSILPAVLLASATALGVAACGGTNPGSDFEDGGGAGGNGGAGGAGGSVGEQPGGPIFGEGTGGGSGGNGSSDGGPACAAARAEATKTPVYMLVVLDASGSMVRDGQNRPVEKWAAATSALTTFLEDLRAKQDKSIGVGLIVFQGGGGSYPTFGDVPQTRLVDDAHLRSLGSRLNGARPEGGTPTAEALEGAYRTMVRFKTEPAGPGDTGFADEFRRQYGELPPGGRKVVVLASDGVPSGGIPAQDRSVELARTHAQSNILTFSIGIGPFPGVRGEYEPAFMGRLAQAGTTAPAGCDPNSTDLAKACHFQITPGGSAQQSAADLLAAMNAIRKAVTSCEYTLSAAGGSGSVDPTKVNVEIKDGSGNVTPVAKNPQDGWSYDDEGRPTKVRLNGASCSRVQSDEKAVVTIVLGCKTQIQ